MNTIDSGMEAFIEFDTKHIPNIFRKARSIPNRVIKEDKETFITIDLLKQMVNILSAFVPSDKRYIDMVNKGVNLTNDDIKHEMELNVRKVYKFVTGKDPDNFKDLKTKSYADAVVLMCSDIKKDVIKCYNLCTTAGKTVLKQRLVEIIIFFEKEILPMLEKIYDRVLLYDARLKEVVSPKILHKLSMDSKKYRKSLIHKLKKENADIPTKSISEYETFTEVVSKSTEDFVKLTHVDMIWDIFDRIITEIDSWR